MDEETRKVVVEIVVALASPIVGFFLALMSALAFKYLKVSVDSAKFRKSEMLDALLKRVAQTAVLKVEDEYRGSKIEDRAERAQAKLESAVTAVMTELSKAGVKVNIDETQAEAAVRAAVMTYINRVGARIEDATEKLEKGA